MLTNKKEPSHHTLKPKCCTRNIKSQLTPKLEFSCFTGLRFKKVVVFTSLQVRFVCHS